MSEKLTPEQIATLLERLAEQIEDLRIPTQLRLCAQELRSPPVMPEPSRSSHHSG